MKLDDQKMSHLHVDLALMENNLNIMLERAGEEPCLKEYYEATQAYLQATAKVKESVVSELNSRKLGG